jgi:hypothetical protein
MELDELKTLIKSKLEEGAVLQTTDVLEANIRKTAGSVTSKIKRNIWFEFAACLICLAIAVLVWLMYSSVYIHLFCIATGLFCIVFSAYLFLLYKKIIFYETEPGTIKDSLQQIITIVTGFTRLYFRISMGLLPVIFIFGLITGYLNVSQQGLIRQFQWSKGIIFYTIAFMAWSVIIYFFSRWYIRKLYGNYLLQLQQQLKDMENG